MPSITDLCMDGWFCGFDYYFFVIGLVLFIFFRVVTRDGKVDPFVNNFWSVYRYYVDGG